MLGPFRMAQVVSIAAIILAILIIYQRLKKTKTHKRELTTTRTNKTSKKQIQKTQLQPYQRVCSWVFFISRGLDNQKPFAD
jgi:predicted histidine transporter YuiF (NhaC family)